MAGAARQYGEPYRYGDEEKRMEKLIFNHRPVWLVIIAALTLYFGFEMTRIKIDARFEKMLPMQHEYLQNMFSRLDDLTQKACLSRLPLKIRRAIFLIRNTCKSYRTCMTRCSISTALIVRRCVQCGRHRCVGKQ